MKFSVFRYGYSYIILTIIFIVLICSSKVQKINIEIMKKYFNILIIFFFVLVTKNFLRIKDNFGVDYYNAPWPKIFSYSKKQKKQKKKKIKKDNKILFYLSKNGLCMYGPAPCSHFMIEQLNVKKKFGYNIYWIKNKN